MPQWLFGRRLVDLCRAHGLRCSYRRTCRRITSRLSGAARLLLVLGLVIGMLGVQPHHVARAAGVKTLFWSDYTNNKIGQMNLGTSGRSDFATGLHGPRGVAVDETNQLIYWTEFGTWPGVNSNTKISKANLDGSGKTDVISSLAFHPHAIAVDPSHGFIFVTSYNPSGLYRLKTDGSGLVNLAISTDQVAINTAEHYIYWTDWDTHVYRATYDTSTGALSGQTTLSSAYYTSDAMAYDGTNSLLFVIDLQGPLGYSKMPAGGGDPVSLSTPADLEGGLAVDPEAQYLYFTEVDNGTGAIRKVPYGGGGIVDVATTGLGDVFGAAIAVVNASAVAPTVTTQAVTGIAATTATGNGNITSLGTPNPTAYGVCWNTTGTPTTFDYNTDLGTATATGAFVTSMVSLTANSTYYVRAYATNTAGTAYGTEVSFTTSPVAPSVTTQAVSGIGVTTATGNGNITSLGAPNPTAYGVCWNTSGTPNVGDSTTNEGGRSATGAFTTEMTGLTAKTQYYVRAYATNTGGTGYGGEVSFTTLGQTPSVVVGSSANPSTAGQAVDLTTTVSGASGTPTGSVGFWVDGASVLTTTLDAQGVATYTTSSLSGGNHPVQVRYVGDSTYDSATGTLSGGQTVDKADSMTSIASSLNPSTFGQTVYFTATVTSGSGLTPTGSLVFSVDDSPVFTATLSGGQATYNSAALGAGDHTVFADYGGDANHNASGVLLSPKQTVNQASSNTTLVSSPNPSAFGQMVYFTATVTSAAGTPTGEVVGWLDGAPVITRTLVGGQATYSFASLSIATHTAEARYAGDANHSASNGALSPDQEVGKAAATTTLVAAPNPSAWLETVYLTATVSGGQGTPTGSVGFWVDGAPVYTATLDGGGVATYVTATLAIGNHPTEARYVGDSTYGASNGALSGGQMVNQAETSTALVSSANPIPAAQTVTFTATVSSANGLPEGEVSFWVDGAPIYSATLDAGGVATWSTANLNVGTHPVTAHYAGDTHFVASVGNLSPDQEVQCLATVTVTSTADSGPGSLRQAIADVCDGGTIAFDLTYPATITLTSDELLLDKDVIISGPGAEQLAVSGNNATRVFSISTDRQVTLDALTVRGGYVAGSGAGISSSGSLTLTRCVLTQNVASGPGGGLYNGLGAQAVVGNSRFTGNSSSTSDGGAIANDRGMVTVGGSYFAENTALASGMDGGAIYNAGNVGSVLVVDGSTFVNNRAYEGGAIRSRYHLSLSNSTLYSNSVSSAGGGGALRLAGAASITNSTIYSNTAPSNGGGVRTTATGTYVMVNTLLGRNSGGNVSLWSSGVGLLGGGLGGGERAS